MGWPKVTIFQMDNFSKAICITVTLLILFYFISSSCFVYVAILKKRGLAGTNTVTVATHRTSDLQIERNNRGEASSQTDQITLNESLGGLEDDFAEDLQQNEERRKAEIHACILSLKTNIILSIVAFSLVFIALVLPALLNSTLILTLKAWAPCITAISNFSKIREQISDLANYLESKFNNLTNLIKFF